MKELKIPSKSLKQQQAEVDEMMSKLIKEQSRVHRLPIEKESINPFYK